MARPHVPVRIALVERGWTIRSVADRLQMSPQVLYSTLNGKPTWPRLRRQLAELLEIDEDTLFPEDARATAVR
jgi:transcriptional regulator with XRE-family HTH domain